MSIRDVGSYIGHNRVTTTSQDSASGIWSLAAVERRMRAAAWPVLVAEDPDFARVSLLLHMDGTGSTFTDSSASPKTLTAAGNVTQSAAQSKWGGKSGYFDGTGDYLTVSDEGQFDFSGDFTIEFWAYSSRTSGNQGGLFSKRDYSTFGGVLLNHYGNGMLQMLATADNSSWSVNAQTATGTFPVSTWAHVAVVRSGSTMTLYVDGVSKATGTINGAIANNSEPFVIAGGGSNGADAFTGYIDEFRVTNSARYLSGFTPPTAAFPDSGPPAAPFSPSDITGLQLWLDASDGSTLFNATSGGSLVAADGGVARWEDKSGNGRHYTQATAANRPTRKVAIQGGNDALRFDGTDDALSRAASIFSNRTAVSWFAVAKNNDTTNGTKMLITERVVGNDGGWRIAALPSQILYGRGSSSLSVPEAVVENVQWPASAVVLSMVTTSTSGTARRNGAFVGTGSGTLANIPYRNLSVIGANLQDDGNLFLPFSWNGLICEIIVYDSALSDASRQAVENYLMTKWGIA